MEKTGRMRLLDMIDAHLQKHHVEDNQQGTACFVVGLVWFDLVFFEGGVSRPGFLVWPWLS